MKRSYPYTGSRQPSVAQNHASGQLPPPPPAGPAPPLPAASAAYANYGYGTVAPARNANMNTTGSSPAATHQANWQSQWQQRPAQVPASASQSSHQMMPQQPQPPQQPIAGPVGHQYPSYNVPPQPYTAYQPQPPVQHQQSYPVYPQAAAPAYNYSPGAYNPSAPQMTGPQPGPPNKKARYNQPPPPAHAAPPVSYPTAPPAQPYGWQGPAPNQHALAAPRPSMPANPTGWVPPNSGGTQANKGRNFVSTTSSRGRQGPQNHGSMRQVSPAQPRNSNFTPQAAYNARPSAPRVPLPTVMPVHPANAGQPVRRPSSSSSVQGGAGQNRSASGSTKGGFSSQNTIPVSGTRGANLQKGRGSGANTSGAASTGPTAPNGNAAAKQASSDSGNTANSKRTHNDFRVLSVEIKELSWSWSVTTDSPHAADDESYRQDETSVLEGSSETVEVQTLDTREEANTESVVSTPDPGPITQAVVDKTDADAQTELHDDTARSQNAEPNIHESGEAESTPRLSTEASSVKSEIEVAEQPAGFTGIITGAKAEPQPIQDAAHTRDSTRLRICFAAIANAGPESAPTEPKVQQDKPAPSAPSPSKPEGDDTISVKQESNSVDAGELGGADAIVKPTEEQVLENAPETEVVTKQEGLEEPLSEPAANQSETEKLLTDRTADAGSADIDHHVAAEADADADSYATESDPKPEGNAAVDKDADEAKEEKDPLSRASSERSGSGRFKKSIGNVKGPAPLSPNRVHLTYASTRKRLAIDADSITSLKFFRSEHRVEIAVQLLSPTPAFATENRRNFNIAKGVLLETRQKDLENYSAVTLQEIEGIWSHEDVKTDPEKNDSSEATGVSNDTTESSEKGPASELPPFFRLSPSSPSQSDLEACQLTVVVHLDPQSPLEEPLWLKKGDPDELLAGLQRVANVAKRAGSSNLAVSHHVWSGKIEVVDPDPPPAFEGLLRDWIRGSFIGGQKERQKFVDDFLAKRLKPAVAASDTTASIANGSDEQPASEGGRGANGVDPAELAADDAKESQARNVESDAERDLRIAKGFVEMAARLVKGERAVTSSKSTPILCRSGRETALPGFEEGTASVSWGGTAMLSLFDLGLRQCAPLLQMGDSTAVAGIAQTWRTETSKLLMELPPALIMKAIDLTWKDVVERQRRDSGSAQARTGTAAGGGGSRQSGGRHHQNNGHSHHNRPSAAFGNKRKR